MAATVRVRDVATIAVGAKLQDFKSFLNGQPGTAIGIYQAPGSTPWLSPKGSTRRSRS